MSKLHDGTDHAKTQAYDNNTVNGRRYSSLQAGLSDDRTINDEPTKNDKHDNDDVTKNWSRCLQVCSL